MVLSDRSAKRQRFVQRVITELGLANAEAWLVDIGREYPAVVQKFDTIVARAVLPVARLWDMVHPLLADDGQVLVFAGTRSACDGDTSDGSDTASPSAEAMPLTEALSQEVNSQVFTRNIPGLEADHQLVRLWWRESSR